MAEPIKTSSWCYWKGEVLRDVAASHTKQSRGPSVLEPNLLLEGVLNRQGQMARLPLFSPGLDKSKASSANYSWSALLCSKLNELHWEGGTAFGYSLPNAVGSSLSTRTDSSKWHLIRTHLILWNWKRKEFHLISCSNLCFYPVYDDIGGSISWTPRSSDQGHSSGLVFSFAWLSIAAEAALGEIHGPVWPSFAFHRVHFIFLERVFFSFLKCFFFWGGRTTSIRLGSFWKCCVPLGLSFEVYQGTVAYSWVAVHMQLSFIFFYMAKHILLVHLTTHQQSGCNPPFGKHCPNLQASFCQSLTSLSAWLIKCVCMCLSVCMHVLLFAHS